MLNKVDTMRQFFVDDFEISRINKQKLIYFFNLWRKLQILKENLALIVDLE
jgi:hypothetical protein